MVIHQTTIFELNELLDLFGCQLIVTNSIKQCILNHINGFADVTFNAFTQFVKHSIDVFVAFNWEYFAGKQFQNNLMYALKRTVITYISHCDRAMDCSIYISHIMCRILYCLYDMLYGIIIPAPKISISSYIIRQIIVAAHFVTIICSNHSSSQTINSFYSRYVVEFIEVHNLSSDFPL